MQGRAHTEHYVGTRNEKEMKKQTSKQLCLCLILFEVVLAISSSKPGALVPMPTWR